MNDLVCFVGQKACIEKDGQLLLLYDPIMGYDLPGGKIMKHETDLKASLQREVREETQLEIDVGLPFYTWFFTIPLNSGHRSAGKKIFTIVYRCTYVSGEVTLSSEHTSFRWINKQNYKECLKTAFAGALNTYFL